jgi:hypothetical protein
MPRWNVIPQMPQIVGFLCYFTARSRKPTAPLRSCGSRIRTGRRLSHRIFQLQVRHVFHGEYANMITVSCLATILFFGGWLSPFPDTLDVATGRTTSRPPAFAAWGIALIVTTVVGYAIKRFSAHQFCRRHHDGCSWAGVCFAPGVIEFIQGPFWFTRRFFVFFSLCLDARHAAALPLRPADVLRLEAAAAGFARERGGDELAIVMMRIPSI